MKDQFVSVKVKSKAWTWWVIETVKLEEGLDIDGLSSRWSGSYYSRKMKPSVDLC
jgi:hypothetical protein